MPTPYLTLVYIHLVTVLPAFAIGTALLFMRKGNRLHKKLGQIYMALMLTTAVVSLFISGKEFDHYRLFNHFSFIHLFSLLALVNVPTAWLAARRGDIKTHRGNMIGLYIGGLLIAGAFAFAPGRLLHQWIFG